MGLFDDIDCQYPLPDDPPTRCFQTKSLGCELRAYEIRRDGTLWALGEVQYVDGERCVLAEDARLRFTGIVTFYGDTDDDWRDEAERDTTWYEYDARLRRGRLVALKVVGSERMCVWLALMERAFPSAVTA